MTKLLSLAFIGTRDFATPAERKPEPARLFRAAAEWCGRTSRLLHTGAAPGADQVAAEAALAGGGRVHLFLPEPRFQTHWRAGLQARYPGRVTETVYDPELHPDWTASVDQYHPSPGWLRPSDRRFHARNYGIVIGAAAVIALPKGPDAAQWGGTGQGMRIAVALGIPLFNLWLPEDHARLLAWAAAEPLAP